MARRALQAGDEVAAVAVHQRRRLGRGGESRTVGQPRQTALGERLEPAVAIRDGVLIPHCRYVVLARVKASEAKTAKVRLIVGLPGEQFGELSIAHHRPCVQPGAVRLWNNPQERRWRKSLAPETRKT